MNIPPAVLTTNHARAGIPDYEDAVYHPAMTALKWITAVALVALLALPAFVLPSSATARSHLGNPC